VERMAAYDALTGALTVLRTPGTATTAETLRAAWQAFRAADGIARALVNRDGQAPDTPPPARIQAAIRALGEALATAPSLPPDHPVPDMAVSTSGTPDAGRYPLILGLGLNTALPEAAELATAPGDRAALYRAAAAARDLACCYDERLRAHLTEAAAFAAADIHIRYPPRADD